MKLLPVAIACTTTLAFAQKSFQPVNQQPNQIGCHVADLSHPQYIGDGFKSRGAGERLVGINIWGGWAGTMPTKDKFTIRVHENTLLFNRPNYDVPKNPPLKTFTGLSPYSVKATGKNIKVYDLNRKQWAVVKEYKLSFLFPSPVQTRPGCVDHWISLASESGSGASFGWESANVDPKGGSNPNASYTQRSGAWSPPTVMNVKNFAMEVNAVTVGPSLCIDSLAANTTATIEVRDTPPAAPVVVALSATGAGPLPTPWGNLLLSAPLFLLPTMQANIGGTATMKVPVPTSAKGAKVWFHALEGGTLKLTNGLAATVK